MKPYQVVALLVLALLGCLVLWYVILSSGALTEDKNLEDKTMRVVYSSSIRGFVYVVEVDGCEYVLYRNNGAAITHKANCKNPEHKP